MVILTTKVAEVETVARFSWFPTANRFGENRKVRCSQAPRRCW